MCNIDRLDILGSPAAIPVATVSNWCYVRQTTAFRINAVVIELRSRSVELAPDLNNKINCFSDSSSSIRGDSRLRTAGLQPLQKLKKKKKVD